MSINKIELPGIILAALYKDSLIVAPGSKNPAPSGTGQTDKTMLNAFPKSAVTSVEKALAIPASLPLPTPSEVTGYKYLGSNRRKTTILVDSPDVAFLQDDYLTFLTKILEACRMNIGDVAIVNQASLPVIINKLRLQLQPVVLLLFGVNPISIKLPIQFPEFKIQEYDGIKYLCVPPIGQLVENSHEGKLLKSKLWMCLKTLFNV